MTCSASGTLLKWDINTSKASGKPMKRALENMTCIVMKEKFGMNLAVYSPQVYKHLYTNEVIGWNASTCEMRSEPIFVKQGS